MVHQLGGGSHRALKLDAAVRIRTSENPLPRSSVNRFVGCPHRREGLVVGVLKSVNPFTHFMRNSSPIHRLMIGCRRCCRQWGGREDFKRGLQRKGVGRSGETVRARALLRKVRISPL